jgi:hypothetical protein
MDNLAKLDLRDTPRLVAALTPRSLQAIREPAPNLTHNPLKNLNTGKETAF